MTITIKDRITQYVIYKGYVSTTYYNTLIHDKDFIITNNKIINVATNNK